MYVYYLFEQFADHRSQDLKALEGHIQFKQPLPQRRDRVHVKRVGTAKLPQLPQPLPYSNSFCHRVIFTTLFGVRGYAVLEIVHMHTAICVLKVFVLTVRESRVRGRNTQHCVKDLLGPPTSSRFVQTRLKSPESYYTIV